MNSNNIINERVVLFKIFIKYEEIVITTGVWRLMYHRYKCIIMYLFIIVKNS